MPKGVGNSLARAPAPTIYDRAVEGSHFPEGGLADTALDYAYRYERESLFELARDGHASLKLATSGGPVANPRLFAGRVLRPVMFADALLCVGAVARSRYYIPPAMLQHIILLADPVATAAADRLRFEAFSSCCSVYARLDMLPGSTDGELLGAGTTNVDLGAEVRGALTSVHEGVEMGLRIGLDEIAVEVDGAAHVERKVKLPARWVKGFLEVQAIQADMAPRLSLDAGAFRRFLRTLPRSSTQPIFIRPADRELVIGHRESAGAIHVGRPDRLRLLERLAAHATGLRVFSGEDGSSAWCLELPEARLTLVLSVEASRGFSGEGRTLQTLGSEGDPRLVARLRADLAWQSSLSPDRLSDRTGAPRDAVAAALATLASSGLVGFDIADGTYFHRVLPFSLDQIERSAPRLRKARKLLADRAVALEPVGDPQADRVAWVKGAHSEYRVRLGRNGQACTCPWWGKHPGDRGPCAHLLAAQMLVQGTAE